MLKLNKITASIQEKIILEDFSFEFEKGKTYAIMGPNGSGKSTLANVIMGHPAYEVRSKTLRLGGKSEKVKSYIEFEGVDITEMETNERADEGIFLSFQSPLALSGVRVYQLLQLAMKGKKDPLAIRNEAKEYASELGISEELLNRPLNEGASGGERKKMEVLQAAVLEKKLVIFDEVDTGVDIDSLKTIAKFLIKYKKDKTYIVITHYNRILHYLKPDYVMIMMGGKVVKVGGPDLAKLIEREGYEESKK